MPSKARPLLTLVASVLLLAGAASDESSWETVSLVRLLAEDESLDGKIIRTTGVLDLGFERQHLCLSEADAENLALTNCVFLYLEEKIANQLEKRFNRKSVVVQARFNVIPAEGYKVNLDDISYVARAGSYDRLEIPEEQRGKFFYTGAGPRSQPPPRRVSLVRLLLESPPYEGETVRTVSSGRMTDATSAVGQRSRSIRRTSVNVTRPTTAPSSATSE